MTDDLTVLGLDRPTTTMLAGVAALAAPWLMLAACALAFIVLGAVGLARAVQSDPTDCTHRRAEIYRSMDRCHR